MDHTQGTFSPSILHCRHLVALVLFAAPLGAGCGIATRLSSEDAADRVDSGLESDAAVDGLRPDAEVTGWRPTTPLPVPLQGLAAVTYDRHVYVLGGDIGGNVQTNAVWSAPVLADGQLGSWTSEPPLAAARASLVSVVANGYLYVLGGANEAVGQVTDVQYSRLGTDGSVGPWRTGPALPSPRMNFGAAVAGNRLYVVAGNYGEAGVNWRDVLMASFNADGSLDGWTTVATLPREREAHAVFASAGRLYIAGGDVTPGFVSDVLSAAVLSDGSLSPWRMEASLPVAAGYWAAAQAGGSIYITGGASADSRAFDLVLAAHPSGAGAIDAWPELEPLPSARFWLAQVAVGGRLYVLGGRSSDPGGAPTSSVLMMLLGNDVVP